MIAVIADDLTGAAEIGGIGVRHGYAVTILNNKVEEVDTDILIIATDSRSLKPSEAGRAIGEITEALLKLHPDLIYKKLDSVLRGNVVEELMAQLIASDKPRALVLPANPALNRTIVDGLYYINEIPLKDYSFAGIAVSSSEVKELMGNEAESVVGLASKGDSLPAKGLIIGNTATEADLDDWVQKLDGGTAPAGGSGFFNAILKANPARKMRKSAPLQFGDKSVFVCGSAFGPSRDLVQKAKAAGQKVLYMPPDIFQEEEEYPSKVELSAEEIVRELRMSNRLILGVEELRAVERGCLDDSIKDVFAEVLAKVMEQTEISELVIEGGATAYAVIQKLGYHKFSPVQELAPGVIRVKVDENPNLHLTLKPGSYPWPESIWQY